MKKVISSLFVLMFSAAILEAMELGKYGNFKFEKTHANVYIMHGPVTEPNIENEGFMNNPAIIEGKTGLIVIDPGGNFNVGKKILAEIEKVSKKPILAAINTHKHGDHWFANKALLEKYPKLRIYAHENMIKEVKAEEAEKWYTVLDRLTKNLKGTNKEFAYPDIALKDGQKIEIDGEKFTVFHPERAHTDTDIMILHENSKTLFLGDNVMKGRLGAFDTSSSLYGNIQTLEKLLKDTNYTLYIPGHGESGEKEKTITPFLTYLKTVRKWAKKAYDDDLEAFEVKPHAVAELKAFHKWDAFDHRVGQHLAKAYSEMLMEEDED